MEKDMSDLMKETMPKDIRRASANAHQKNCFGGFYPERRPMRAGFRKTREKHQDNSIPCQNSLEFGHELIGILRAQGSNISERLPQVPFIKFFHRRFPGPPFRASYPRSHNADPASCQAIHSPQRRMLI